MHAVWSILGEGKVGGKAAWVSQWNFQYQHEIEGFQALCGRIETLNLQNVPVMSELCFSTLQLCSVQKLAQVCKTELGHFKYWLALQILNKFAVCYVMMWKLAQAC